MTEFDLVWRAHRAELPSGQSAADVGVTNGVITAVADYGTLASPTLHEYDSDVVLLPGLVDTHVHMNEPGRTQWEGFDTATRAAANGGITTLVDMPLNCIPATVDVPALLDKRDVAQGRVHVDVGFWAGAVPHNLGALAELHDEGVFGFKAFLLPSGVDEFPPLDHQQLLVALRELATFDGLLIVHAEDCAAIAEASPPEGRHYDSFLASRPDDAEVRAVEAVLAALEHTGGRAHIVHVSSASVLTLIADAKARGIRISAETCPHYLTFSSDAVPVGATWFKCCPPIREAGNREALWQGLRDGVLDLVVSDHSPCTPDLKHIDTGDFAEAWGGIASLQLGLSVMWTGAHARGISLTEVVRWMAAAPAALVGLQDKGSLAVGMSADAVVFAPDESFEVDGAQLAHRHPITPYQGQLLQGVVRATWLHGAPVGSRRGNLLTRGAA